MAKLVNVIALIVAASAVVMATPTCKPCNPSSWICNGTLNPSHCPSSFPMICTKGARKGECGDKAEASGWKSCDECCDTSACFKPCGPCPTSVCDGMGRNCGKNLTSFCETTNGCGAPGAFPNWNCPSCCDLSTCPPAPPVTPAPTPAPTVNPATKKCKKCSPSSWICNATLNPSHCPASIPMICTKGLRKGECGTQHEVAHWGKCDECCDTAGCFEPCGTCPKSVCDGKGRDCGKGLSEFCLTNGGCGANGTFPNWNCPSCCDLSTCPPPPPVTPAPTPAPTENPATKKCKPCNPSSAICNGTLNPNHCPASIPMICTKGVRAGECGTQRDLAHWGSCSDCCDTAACFKPCAPCTVAQCNASQCTNGTAQLCLTNGGCGASGTFPNWNCPSCCDLSSC